jgi:hypothetical protein
VASRSASAGEGIRFEDDDVFVASNPGTLRVGTSILGKTAQVYGSRHGLIPGATNCIMAAGDTPPAESPADIAFSGEYRERWLHLARS